MTQQQRLPESQTAAIDRAEAAVAQDEGKKRDEGQIDLFSDHILGLFDEDGLEFDNNGMPPDSPEDSKEGMKQNSPKNSKRKRRRTLLEGAFNNSPPPSWHSEAADKAHRQQLVIEIAQLLQARKRSAPSQDWMQQLPHKARKLEGRLYHTAASLEAYLDRTTLRTRLRKLAEAISKQHREHTVILQKPIATSLTQQGTTNGRTAALWRNNLHSREGSTELEHQQAINAKLQQEIMTNFQQQQELSTMLHHSNFTGGAPMSLPHASGVASLGHHGGLSQLHPNELLAAQSVTNSHGLDIGREMSQQPSGGMVNNPTNARVPSQQQQLALLGLNQNQMQWMQQGNGFKNPSMPPPPPVPAKDSTTCNMASPNAATGVSRP